jgi:5-formyltetrahydrofolate cyclo-ligase
MHTEKQVLRSIVRAQLRSLSSEEIEKGSVRICEHLKTEVLGCLREGEGVALFGGLKSEPDLITLVTWMSDRGVRSFFFGIENNEMVPCEIKGPSDLKRGPMGVWEPASLMHRLRDLSRLSVVLTPGLAFDSQTGSRLGRGAGFYDRFFSTPGLSAKRIGIAFDCQIRDDIPTESHDARIDSLITESGFRKV